MERKGWSLGRSFVMTFVISFLLLFSLTIMNMLVTQSCSPIDCSPSGSSVHGILQARILEWVAIPFSRGPS